MYKMHYNVHSEMYYFVGCIMMHYIYWYQEGYPTFLVPSYGSHNGDPAKVVGTRIQLRFNG